MWELYNHCEEQKQKILIELMTSSSIMTKSVYYRNYCFMNIYGLGLAFLFMDIVCVCVCVLYLLHIDYQNTTK